MTKIRVDVADRAYDVVVKSGVLSQSAEYLSRFCRQKRMLVITDDRVAEHVLPQLRGALALSGIAIDHFTLPHGEGAKSWANLEGLADWLLSHEVERSDYIIALGGGVVGDITGFAAHIVKRGCGFIQIPTTLLAQVDSSVGGKTAINSKAGKNLIGVFEQPALVLIDPAVLTTLPRRELAAGFAEVVKYGLIDSPDFFNYCDANLDAFFSGDTVIREQIIVHSVTAKARIVAADERELTGVRALLNLGHTFGHALEADTGFSSRLLHGEGVACGMALAFHYSVRLGICPESEAEKVQTLLRRANLPTTLNEAGITSDGATLVDHMLHDKKRSGGNLPFLLANGIGQTILRRDVELSDVAKFLDSEIARG
jgi:3-dehydroquinate synthase